MTNASGNVWYQCPGSYPIPPSPTAILRGPMPHTNVLHTPSRLTALISIPYYSTLVASHPTPKILHTPIPHPSHSAVLYRSRASCPVVNKYKATHPPTAAISVGSKCYIRKNGWGPSNYRRRSAGSPRDGGSEGMSVRSEFFWCLRSFTHGMAGHVQCCCEVICYSGK